MRLAPVDESTPGPDRGIRDTSATDIAIERPGSQKSLIWIGAIVLSVITAGFVFYPVINRWAQAEITVPRERLRFAVVERGDFVRDVGVQGTVVAAVSPTLFSSAQGTVTLRIKAGDNVEEGSVLATLESPELRSQLLQQLAALQGLQTEFERQRIEIKRQQLENQQTIDLANVKIIAAERELRRAEVSRSSQVISEQDYDKAVDDVNTARLEYAHAKQNGNLAKEVMDFELKSDQLAIDRQALVVSNLQRQVDELEIVSPVTGMIGSLMVEQKAAVSENQPLLTVVDLSAFEVEIQVPESYGDDLHIGMDAEITYAGRRFAGVVTAVSPEVRNNQVTGRVRFARQPPGGLRQNQRVSVRIILESSNNVLMVRRGPFLDSGGGRIAYVMRDGLAERRLIGIGASSINSIQIVRGLDEGETIVTSSVSQFDGANVVYVTD